MSEHLSFIHDELAFAQRSYDESEEAISKYYASRRTVCAHYGGQWYVSALSLSPMITTNTPHLADLCTLNSGIVGSGIITQFLSQGASVVAPVRSANAKEALLAEVAHTTSQNGATDRLDVIVIDTLASSNGMAQLEEYVKAKHPSGVDHVVSCFGGGFQRGTASALTADDVHSAADRALPHLQLSKVMIPMLCRQPRSSLTFITGLLGERCSMPDCAALTISNATLYGIIRAVEAECAEEPFRINEVRIGALLRKDSAPGHPFITSGRAYPATLVGREIVKLATGLSRREIIRVLPSDLEKI